METDHVPQTATKPPLIQGSRTLVIGPVWPEPRSSAAGKRSEDWIRFFQAQGAAEVTFASIAKPDEHSARLQARGIPIRPIAPNDPAFDTWVQELRPDWVVLERFTIEEMFGWRLRERCPTARQLLDTVDLHFLRRARAAGLDDAQALLTDDALRELASLWRVDRGLVLSEAERALVLQAGLPPAQIGVYGFGYPEPRVPSARGDREIDFGFIGNFRHAPNADAVRWLKAELWPEVRRRFAERGRPRPVLHVHGAYPSKEFMQMDRAGEGFRVLGPAADAHDFLARVRVNLAPLRFGAGLKGKIADGWAVGTPCVATPVGAEGMGVPFGGLVAESATDFAQKCLELHADPDLWTRSQAMGHGALRGIFSERAQNESLVRQLAGLAAPDGPPDLAARLLRHHSIQSARHLSRWIEIKNAYKNLATGIPNETPKLEDCALSSPEVRSPQLM